MGGFWLRLRVCLLAVSAGLCALWPVQAAAQQFNAPSRTASSSGSISSKFQHGLDRFAQMLTPKTPVKEADDAVSLSSKARPRAETYVAVARLYEQSGNIDQAVKQYEKALQLQPDYLGALLGLARVKTNTGKPEQALKLYHQAAKAHPQQASVYNNLGVFYGMQGNFNASVEAFSRAIQLQPRKPNYRANIAAVLVHLGRNKEAFTHLRAIESEAVAYYNLGFLLKGEGQTQAAADHFAAALRIDGSLQPARYWLQQLEATTMQARTPSAGSPSGIRVGSRPIRPPAPLPPPAASGPVGQPPEERPSTPHSDSTRAPIVVRPSAPSGFRGQGLGISSQGPGPSNQGLGASGATYPPVPAERTVAPSNDGTPAEVRQLPPPPRDRDDAGQPTSQPSGQPPQQEEASQPASSGPRRLPPVSRRTLPAPALEAPLPTGSYPYRPTAVAAPLPSQPASSQ